MKTYILRIPAKRVSHIILFVCCALFCTCLTVFFPKKLLPVIASENREEITLPVLMYHHILREGKLLGDYCITPEEFAADLDYLKEQGYSSVTISQLVDYCENGTPLPEKSVLITFDDGYESTYYYAYPILKEKDMTACVSLIGYYSDLYTQIDDSHINYAHLTWNQINELARSGIFEIGNHTYNLHSLDKGRKGCKINRAEDPDSYRTMLTEDLVKTQEAIQRHTNQETRIFAFPFGAICGKAREVLDSLGFSVVFTCEEKVNQLTGDPRELKYLGRFNRPHNVDRKKFFSKILK